MQTLFDIRKRTEYASYEKHVDNAPKAPSASKRTRPAANKKSLGLKDMQFRKRTRHSASKTAKKTPPDALTDYKKHTRHPASKLI